MSWKHDKAWIPERSKGTDLRSVAICFVGSNPTPCKCSYSSDGRASVL